MRVEADFQYEVFRWLDEWVGVKDVDKQEGISSEIDQTVL
jgi:hypothetical protein